LVELLSEARSLLGDATISEIWDDKAATIANVSKIEDGETLYAATTSDISNDTKIVM